MMTSLILDAGQVDVWMTKTDNISDDELIRCESVLNGDELAKLNKFVVKDAKLQYLLARTLVRTSLSRYAHRKPEEWMFVSNSYGRPRLASGMVTPPLYFNLSHTNGMVVCAVSLCEKVGIDIERIDRKVDHMRMAQAAFTGSEISRLESTCKLDRSEIFFSHWTLKEAYIKARGMGFSIPLKAFGFTFFDSILNISFSAELPDDPLRWQFNQFAPTRVHRIAVAASFSQDHVVLNINLHIVSVADMFDIDTDNSSLSSAVQLP